ncbi:hypothetical protein BDZ91DRAFT_656526 [Kalaharituber pfeilii]|nr:hypothetical protein BDZ91DRAFT_656526 [Kalaharituber pfeilii]
MLVLTSLLGLVVSFRVSKLPDNAVKAALTGYHSSVGLAPQCVPSYEELKLGKKVGPKLIYIIYKLSDDKRNIEVEATSSESDYDSFLSALPENDCRYAVYDFSYELDGGEGKRNKLVFFSWAPDGAPVRSKMLYASSKDALRRALTGIGAEIQGTDASEVAWDSVLEKVSKVKSTS